MRAVNLLPRDSAAGGGARTSADAGRGAYMVIAVLAVLVAMTSAWALSKGQLAEQRTELGRLVAEAGSAEARSAASKPYTDFAVLRQARVDTVSGLLDGRFDWSRSLRDLGRAIPGEVSITSLVATASPEAKVAGGGSGQSLRGAAAGPAIDLVGCARTTVQVADLLIALRAIDGVEQVSLASAEKSDVSSQNETECRADDQMPQFSLTIAYEQAPAAAATAPATAAPAAGAASTTGAPE